MKRTSIFLALFLLLCCISICMAFRQSPSKPTPQTTSGTQGTGHQDGTDHKHTNALAKESSPYLLMHAHNPVNWYPWNQETLALAKKEDKRVLQLSLVPCDGARIVFG